MRIGLVTDSPSDLPDDLIQKYNIGVVPAILVLDGKSYLDGEDITRNEFYTRLVNLKKSPTTAAPAGEEFAKRYRQMLASNCDHVIGIFTAEKLTATANIARKAAEDFAGKVSVLESGSLTLGTGFQILAAAEAIEKGLDLPDVLTSIQSTRERLCIYAALDSMEYLRRSGRVTHTVAALGGLLSIKPVVELHEGRVKPVGAPRTTHQATKILYNLLRELGPLERLVILHTNAEMRAQEFLDQLLNTIGDSLPEDIRITNITPVIGTHVGPNGLGAAAIKIYHGNHIPGLR